MPCPDKMKLHLTEEQTRHAIAEFTAGREPTIELYPDQADHLLRRLLDLIVSHVYALRCKGGESAEAHAVRLHCDDTMRAVAQLKWHNPQGTFSSAWPEAASHKLFPYVDPIRRTGDLIDPDKCDHR